ncbi:uncharacterized protein [Ptychodera flava]|uniref:uncharacterized protein n=1 Tax=Ptychodera flava TaxID=63121 RepID=UPI00396A9573
MPTFYIGDRCHWFQAENTFDQSWISAVDWCRSRGGYLVKFETQSEESAVTSYINFQGYTKTDEFWTSGKCQYPNDVYNGNKCDDPANWLWITDPVTLTTIQTTAQKTTMKTNSTTDQTTVLNTTKDKTAPTSSQSSPSPSMPQSDEPLTIELTTTTKCASDGSNYNFLLGLLVGVAIGGVIATVLIVLVLRCRHCKCERVDADKKNIQDNRDDGIATNGNDVCDSCSSFDNKTAVSLHQ